MTTKIQAIGEAALRVNDLPVMRRFYEDVFGLEPLRASNDAVLYRIAPGYKGHTQVFGLFARGVAVSPQATTVDHIAFTIDREDFESEQARLRALGLNVRLADHPWAHWRSQRARPRRQRD
jgi:catechol-2,3-dioxygenase